MGCSSPQNQTLFQCFTDSCAVVLPLGGCPQCTPGCVEAALLRLGLGNEQRAWSALEQRQPKMGFVFACSLAGGVASWMGNLPG